MLIMLACEILSWCATMAKCSLIVFVWQAMQLTFMTHTHQKMADFKNKIKKSHYVKATHGIVWSTHGLQRELQNKDYEFSIIIIDHH